jgi:DNA (cytosine-5)-methyltransferase 1
MSRPVIVDLYCCAGGAAKGYHQAGFEVVGIDKEPQPNYPYEFIKGDALTVADKLMRSRDVAAWHASPTCQRKARVTAWRGNREDHPNTLTPTLAWLRSQPLPYVVENVPEAADELRPDFLLCGTQFGLNVRRHRIFEAGNWSPAHLVPPCQCHRNPRLLPFMHKGERAFADAMGCDWMTNREARQAIPPAFTRSIGELLLAAIEVTA